MVKTFYFKKNVSLKQFSMDLRQSVDLSSGRTCSNRRKYHLWRRFCKSRQLQGFYKPKTIRLQIFNRNFQVESEEQEKSDGTNDGEKEDASEKESDEDEENEAKNRKRRSIAPIVTSIDMIEAGILSQCKEKQCSVLKCKIRDLVSQDAATIEVAARVNVRLLKEVISVKVNWKNGLVIFVFADKSGWSTDYWVGYFGGNYEIAVYWETGTLGNLFQADFHWHRARWGVINIFMW